MLNWVPDVCEFVGEKWLLVHQGFLWLASRPSSCWRVDDEDDANGTGLLTLSEEGSGGRTKVWGEREGPTGEERDRTGALSTGDALSTEGLEANGTKGWEGVRSDKEKEVTGVGDGEGTDGGGVVEGTVVV